MYWVLIIVESFEALMKQNILIPAAAFSETTAINRWRLGEDSTYFKWDMIGLSLTSRIYDMNWQFTKDEYGWVYVSTPEFYYQLVQDEKYFRSWSEI